MSQFVISLLHVKSFKDFPRVSNKNPNEIKIYQQQRKFNEKLLIFASNKTRIKYNL
jgi:hypothetical protein